MLREWPYPRWIAHRGAGVSAPENTLAAFQLGYDAGFRMFECDAKLSADGVVFLLHDTTLDRTTNAKGMAHTFHWNQLCSLDAGSWHGKQFAGASIPTLEQLAHFCIERHCHLNIEIKPSPGFEFVTGERVAKEAQRLWANQPNAPLLTSFRRASLRGALSAAPALPRGLLMHEPAADWHQAIETLQCDVFACHFSNYHAPLVEEIHRLGLYCLAYTVNEAANASQMLDMGVDSIVTDNLSFCKTPPGDDSDL